MNTKLLSRVKTLDSETRKAVLLTATEEERQAFMEPADTGTQLDQKARSTEIIGLMISTLAELDRDQFLRLEMAVKAARHGHMTLNLYMDHIRKQTAQFIISGDCELPVQKNQTEKGGKPATVD